MNNWFDKPRVDLIYNVDKWSIQIRKENIENVEHFPRAIYLKYCTKPCGLSLLWRKNQVPVLTKMIVRKNAIYYNYRYLIS